MNRSHWYVALLQVGLLAVCSCSSDDSAPGDTSGAAGSDSGVDQSASGGSSGAAGSQQGGAGPDGSAGSQQGGSAPDASGGAAPDSNVAETAPESGLSDVVLDASEAGASDVASDAPGDSFSCALCPSGVCLEGGICASCTGDLHCQGSAWRCDLNSHSCVPCLPGATDNCPSSQYCTAAFACVAGCKSNAECTSGVCATHECEHCQKDVECTAGHVCGSGTCAAACTPQGGCGNGFDCCTGHCVSLARDFQHCGACATACTVSQFCSTTGCATVAIANLCGNAKTTKILDNYPPDDASGAVLQAAIVANCVPAPTTGSSTKDSPGPVNTTTGQPVEGGGDLLTVAGGFYVQPLVAYLDQIGATPVYLEHGNQTYWRYLKRGGGAAGPDGGPTDALLIQIPQIGPSHDIILIETVRDPSSGTLVLIAYGQYEESTAAAARYVANQMLPIGNRASYDKSWYVYEWTAANDAGPETYTLRASAP